MNETVMILGASGLIGGHIAREALSQGKKIIIVTQSNSSFPNLEDIKDKYSNSIETLSITNFDSQAFKDYLKKADYFIHAAIPYQLFTIDWEKKWQKEQEEQKELLELLLKSKLKRVVFVSVAGTIGPKLGSEPDENSPYVPSSDTTSLNMKFLSENLIKSYIDQGLPGIIINSCLAFGPYDSKPSSGEFLIVLSKLPFYIFKDYLINIVDVRDVAKASLSALELGKIGDRYLVGNLNLTVGDFQKQIKKIEGKYPPLFSLPDSLVVSFAYASEYLAKILRLKRPLIPVLSLDILRYGSRDFKFDKLKNELKLTPRDPFLGVRDALEWFHKKKKI